MTDEVKERVVDLLGRLAREYRAAALLAAGVGAVVVALTFCLSYATILVGTVIWGLRLRHNTLMWLSVGFVALLFLLHRRERKPALDELEFSETEEQGVAWMGFGASPFAGVLGMAMAPRAVGSMARVVVDVLCTGPRLMAAALGTLRQAGRLRRLDADGIAAVLTVLVAHPGRVALDELSPGIEGLNGGRVFRQIRLIPGVVFLATPPAGLSLTPELRAELLGL